jgi:hypothetical protein
MILVIAYGIMKITKSLGVDTSYSMRRSCTKISFRERNKKNKKHNTQFLMSHLKINFNGTRKSKCTTTISIGNSNSYKCC